ncbi:hypothetical protein Tco_1382102 [Tanacetum coccineum]
MNEYNQKDILFKMRRESKSYNKNLTHKDLYDALVKSLLVDEDDMDRGVVESSTQKKRRHDNEGQDPPPDSKKEKKRQRRNMLAHKRNHLRLSKPAPEVAMDTEEHNANDDVVNDADQPQDDAALKHGKPIWFKQPSRPPTPDP